MDNGGERKRMPRLVGGSGLEDANSARRVQVVSPIYSGGEPRKQGPGCGAEGGIRPMRPRTLRTMGPLRPLDALLS